MSVPLNKEQQITEINIQCKKLIAELQNNTTETPEQIVRKHIQLLRRYNEMRDLAMSLIRMIASNRGIKAADIMEEMNVSNDD